MRNKFFYSILMFVSGITFFYACRHEFLNPGNGNTGSGGNGTVPASPTCSSDTIYFVNDILPIIASNCTMSGCHDNITHAEGVNLTTYSGILRIVTPGNAGRSKLYTSLNNTGNERMPPAPMAALSVTQKSKISTWINQGAINNNCKGSCDTAVFTFSGAVKPIIDNKCVGCHNPNSPGGNIDVSNYYAVKVVVLNGKLFGSVAHQTGYSPMPKNSARLSDCEIRQVQKWITTGTLNN